MHRQKKNLLKYYKLLQIGKPRNSFAVFPKLLQSVCGLQSGCFFAYFHSSISKKYYYYYLFIFCFKHFSSTQVSKITYVCLFFLFVHRLLSIKTHLQNGQHQLMEITLILTSAVGEASNVTYPMTLKKEKKKKASYIIKHG